MSDFNSKPSLKLSFFFILLYQFAAMPFAALIIYGFIFLGFGCYNLRAYFSEVFITAQIALTSFLTFILIKKYPNFLLSKEWRKSYLRYLAVGLKFSFPILLLHGISLSIPIVREKLISGYLSMKIISLKDASSFALIIFSFLLALCAIFEELFFRGIIVQKLQKITNRNLSIIISATFFAIFHFFFSEINIGKLTSSFLIGVLSGVAFTSTGSCISAILPHLINNIICVGFIWAIR